MASRKTSPPKPAKAVVKPRPAKAVVKPRPAKAVVKDLRTGIEDLRAIDPDHPWVRLLKEAVAALRDDHLDFVAVIKCVQTGLTMALTEITREHREGLVQVKGELEQIRTHLARFIDAGIRERGRDERIEAQLSGINERLRERSRDGRVVRHGKTTTAEELSRELDATERSFEEKLESAFAVTRQKEGEICGLQNELVRIKSELDVARATAATLDRRPMPPPQRSWRTVAAEKVTDAPLD